MRRNLALHSTGGSALMPSQYSQSAATIHLTEVAGTRQINPPEDKRQQSIDSMSSPGSNIAPADPPNGESAAAPDCPDGNSDSPHGDSDSLHGNSAAPNGDVDALDLGAQLPKNLAPPLIKYMTLTEWGTFREDARSNEGNSDEPVKPRHIFEVLIDEQVRVTRKSSSLIPETRKMSKPRRSPIGSIPPSWSKVRALQLLINSSDLIGIFKDLIPKFDWGGSQKAGRVVLVRPFKMLVLYEAEIRERYRLLEHNSIGFLERYGLPEEALRQQRPPAPAPAPPPLSTPSIVLQEEPGDDEQDSSTELSSESEMTEEETTLPERPAGKPDEATREASSDDDMLKAPVRLKDAVGRKFSFPFHMCKTWAGMTELIRSAFLHVDVVGNHVADGHYDLISPDGDIILPQIWESVIQPDWALTMHMWPMPEPGYRRTKAFPSAPVGRLAPLQYSPQALEHLGLLIRFMDQDLEDLFELRRRIADGTLDKIAFDDLWHLFDYGQEVFIREDILDGKIKAARVLKFTGGRTRVHETKHESKAGSTRLISEALGPGSWGHAFAVQCWSLSFDSDLYWPQEQIVGIRPYEGEIEITSLPVYPSVFEKRPHVRRNLAEQGRLYSQFASTTFSHRRYVGRNLDEDARGEQIDSEVIIDFATALNTMEDWSPEDFRAERDQIDHDMRELWEEYPEHGHCNSKGWCIRNCVGPDFALDIYMLQAFIRDNKQVLQPRESIGEEEFVFLPDRVFGFVLNRKTWAILTTSPDCLLDVEKTSAPWKDLVLDEQTKHIVEALVDQHIQRPANHSQNDTPFQLGDFITGKGRSLVLLLHGPPGVGKTSTAECIAAHMNKPLYPLTSGNLPVRPEELEIRLEEHFNLAERWGCILLLDEADVFLQRRQLHALEINAMVSVFLRQLEYYKGILFLTTNRVGDMDPAFKSRVHVSLEYDPLNRQRTKKIYKLHLRRIEEALEARKANFEIRKEEIMVWAKKHFKSAEKEHRQWNGRQIHNAFQTAVALAEWESRSESLKAKDGRAPKTLVLGKKQFKRVAVVSEGFDQYMTELMGGRDESDLAAVNSERYDYRPSKSRGKEKSTRLRSDSEDSTSDDSDSSNINDDGQRKERNEKERGKGKGKEKEKEKEKEKKSNSSEDSSDDSDEKKSKTNKKKNGKKNSSKSKKESSSDSD